MGAEIKCVVISFKTIIQAEQKTVIEFKWLLKQKCIVGFSEWNMYVLSQYLFRQSLLSLCEYKKMEHFSAFWDYFKSNFSSNLFGSFREWHTAYVNVRGSLRQVHATLWNVYLRYSILSMGIVHGSNLHMQFKSAKRTKRTICIRHTGQFHNTFRIDYCL